MNIPHVPEGGTPQQLRKLELERVDNTRQVASFDSRAAFQYQPLRPKEFRLLDVLPCPRTTGATLRCLIRHVSLEQDPKSEYEAISYLWGDSAPSVVIQVNGVDLYLPVNSEKALRRMALPGQTRTLYVDAVCINQADTIERAGQVLLMGDIYMHAKATLVYLGPEDNTITAALENIVLLSEELKADVGSRSGIAELVLDVHGNDIRAEHFIRSPVNVAALASFFQLPWFRRVWIVQEVALASRSRLICGSHEVNMDSILEIAVWFGRHHIDHIPHELWAALQGAMAIWEVKDFTAKSGGINLDELLFYGRDRNTTDARDKVYGMLGLLKHAKLQTPLIPDYTKPFQHVLRDTVRQCLAIADTPLDLLRHISHRHDSDLCLVEFPSWVPRLDRSSDFRLDPALLGTRNGRGLWGDTALARRAIPSVEGDGDKDENTLTVHGLPLGSITAVSSVFNGTATNIRKIQLEAIVNWHAEAKALRDMHCASDTKIDLERALIADTGPYQPANCDADPQGFFALLDHTRASRDVPRIDQFTDATEHSTRLASEYRQAFFNACDIRRFAVMSNRSIALVPKLSRPSDVAVVLHGSDRPFVLRPSRDEYLLIGECHVDGWMIWQEHGADVQHMLRTETAQIYRIK